MSRHDVRTGADHERARELAAARIDEVLAPADEAWLAEHLDACPSCAAVAAEYDAQHGMLVSLRQVTLEAPRDLWARTSAAIDAERPRGRGRSWRPLLRSPRRSSPFALAPAVAAIAIIAVVGAGLLNGGRLLPGGVTATPIAISGAADLQVLALDSAGNLRLLSRRVDQVCPTGVSDCGPAATFSVAAVSSFGTVDSLYGAVSPTGGQIVIVSGGPGNQGVYVVPVKAAVATAKPTTSASQIASPSGPVSPTASQPVTTPTKGPDASGTTRPSDHSSGPTPSSTATPSSAAPSPSTPAPSTSAPSSAPPTDMTSPPPSGPSGSPAASPTASQGETPGAGPSGSPVESAAVSSPTPPAGSESSSVAPSAEATPAAITPIRIATDVTVVGAPVYSPDGTQLAFSALPTSGGAGPDIYVWTVGDPAARAITSDHGSWLAGWTGQGILVSRVAGGVPSTFTLDPTTAEATPVGPDSAWLPSVSPSGSMAAWWSGTVKLAADGVTWQPDQGQLVLGPWPGAQPGATPSAAPDGAHPQVLASSPIDGWHVDWDDTGASMGVWIAAAGSGTDGRLSLYSIDGTTATADLAAPMLDAVPANPDFSLRAGRLAWTTPSPEGPQVVNVLVWSGSTVYPPMTVAADGKGTVIP